MSKLQEEHSIPYKGTLNSFGRRTDDAIYGMQFLWKEMEGLKITQKEKMSLKIKMKFVIDEMIVLLF